MMGIIPLLILSIKKYASTVPDHLSLIIRIHPAGNAWKNLGIVFWHM